MEDVPVMEDIIIGSGTTVKAAVVHSITCGEPNTIVDKIMGLVGTKFTDSSKAALKKLLSVTGKM